MVNKKGQVFFYGLMLGLTLMVLALALAGPLKSIIDTARAPTTSVNKTYTEVIGGETFQFNGTIESPGLDCANESISTYDKGACIVADLTIFHFIGGVIFIAGAVMIAKFAFQ
jgi:hypothetical protein